MRTPKLPDHHDYWESEEEYEKAVERYWDWVDLKRTEEKERRFEMKEWERLLERHRYTLEGNGKVVDDKDVKLIAASAWNEALLNTIAIITAHGSVENDQEMMKVVKEITKLKDDRG